jgi:hypothetical protein
MIVRVALVVALVVALFAGHAVAADAGDAIREAHERISELRYEDALQLVDRAWQAGGATPPQLRELFAIAGQAAGSIGDDDAARLWFSRWLCIEPEAQLPAGTSPKLTALFAQARDALAGRALTATAVRNEHAIAVSVKSDPLALAVAVRAGTYRFELDNGFVSFSQGMNEAPELLDRHGNVLAVVAVDTFVSMRSDTPLVARWSTWAVVSAGFAVVGGGAVWVALDARSSIRALNADSPNHQFSEARALERRFDRAQWVARISLGASAAAAIASAVLWRRTERVVIAPSANGASVSWVQSF